MNKKNQGFTLIEILAAMSLLVFGSASLWYMLGFSREAQIRAIVQREALLAAQNEMENLRSRNSGPNSGSIEDTLYTVNNGQGRSLIIRRDVLDSSQLVEMLDEIKLDENFRPLELRKPKEIRIDVFQERSGNENFLQDIEIEEEEPIVSLGMLLPQVEWY